MYVNMNITAISGPQTLSNSDTTKPQDEKRRENDYLLKGEECEDADREKVTDTDDVEDAG